MSKFAVSTDSTCDFYANEIAEKNIYFLPLTFTLTDKKGAITEYKDEFKSYDEYVNYYNQVRAGMVSKTSMNNPFVHIEHFTKMAENGVTDAIHFTISYGLCRTVDVAREAVEAVKEKYPNFNCLCVECSTTTIGQGMLVNIAIDMRDKGATLKETFDYVENIKHKIQYFIIADSLIYLMKGGRVSAAKATIGTILNVKPVLIFNKEGKLFNFMKGKGTRHTINLIAEEFKKYTLNNDYPIVVIGHTDNVEYASLLKKALKDKYNVEPEIRIIGPVIGSHLGPNAVAYAFISNEERPV